MFREPPMLSVMAPDAKNLQVCRIKTTFPAFGGLDRLDVMHLFRPFPAALTLVLAFPESIESCPLPGIGPIELILACTFALLIVPLCIFGFILSFICLVLRHTLGTVRLAVGVELATLRAGLQEHQSFVSVILMLISIGS